MISGEGVPLDAVIGDFMSGAVEDEVMKAIKEKNDYIFVEGQGSILHPAWSSVTLALIHGALPHKMILCHKAKSKFLKNTKVEIQPFKEYIKIYENITLPLRKAKVVGIGLNTVALSEEEAKKEIINIEKETGLPCDDIFRFKSDKLLNACLN